MSPSICNFLLNKDRCSDLHFYVDEKKAHKTLADPGSSNVRPSLLRFRLSEDRSDFFSLRNFMQLLSAATLASRFSRNTERCRWSLDRSPILLCATDESLSMNPLVS